MVFRGKLLWTVVVALLFLVCAGRDGIAQAGLGLNPGRIEVAVNPGEEKTVSFEIEAPPSESPVRGRLLLSLTDWNVDDEGKVIYADPGTMENSSAPWAVFSPSAVSITSGQKQLVRVTVRLPGDTKPGVYRSGLFVQERPPATPPKQGEHLLYVRFRYVFTLYVIVPPVLGEGNLADLRIESNTEKSSVVCVLKNAGSLHVRPIINLAVYNAEQGEIASVKKHEGMVVLPHSSVNEKFMLPTLLPSGRYEVSAQVDFRDGNPVQSVNRIIEVSLKIDASR